MDEQSEIPQEIPSKEQMVVPSELAQAMAGAEQRIVAEARQPAADIVDRTAGMGLFAAVVEAVKPHLKQKLEIKFKNFKAMAMAAISLVPLLGSGASAARAAGKVARTEGKLAAQTGKLRTLTGTEGVAGRMGGKIGRTKEALKAAKVEYRQLVRVMEQSPRVVGEQLNRLKRIRGIEPHLRATAAKLPKARFGIFLKEVEAGVGHSMALEHAKRGIDTTISKVPRLFGKEVRPLGIKIEMPTGQWKYGARVGAERIGESWLLKTLHGLNPYPDVPGSVQLVGFLDVIPGVVGAEVVPAAWQLVSNYFQEIKVSYGLSKDVGRVVLDRLGFKLRRLKEPPVARAAAAFA